METLINILDQIKKDQQLFVVEKVNQTIRELTIYQDCVNLDMSIRCKLDQTGKTISIYQVQRDKEFLIGQYVDLEFGQVALHVVVSSYFHQSKPDSVVRKQLRDANGITEAREILEEQIGKAYFSLFKEETGKINLIKVNDDCYEIYYLSNEKNRIPITTKNSLSNAFAVVYNYGFFLKAFEVLIEKMSLLHNLKLTKEETEELKRLFLKK